jgi:hypothetical protein
VVILTADVGITDTIICISFLLIQFTETQHNLPSEKKLKTIQLTPFAFTQQRTQFATKGH